MTIVHIPDGFLSTPVWAAMDVAAAPAVGYVARKAQQGFDDAKVPLLGVMGAFVFAAQMINFPVGVGTSGHLVGGALLACTLGPAAASVVMCAILAIQALVFQDGGILALGANVFNMAIAGVLAGYLPYYLWGRGPGRRASIFAGGALSLLTSAILALAELLISGVRMPGPVLGVSVALFVVSALVEGAITMAVVIALERIQPNLMRAPGGSRSPAFAALALVAVLLAAGGVVFASTAPDGIERLAMQTGIASHARTLIATPLKDYQAAWLGSGWAAQAGAGLAGLGLVYGACLMIGRKR
ncbi:MAG TPA: energy-coupling factor ABC transporter permease [Candidatus Solibacter sp.]